jgi:hypothetical protein
LYGRWLETLDVLSFSFLSQRESKRQALLAPSREQINLLCFLSRVVVFPWTLIAFFLIEFVPFFSTSTKANAEMKETMCNAKERDAVTSGSVYWCEGRALLGDLGEKRTTEGGESAKGSGCDANRTKLGQSRYKVVRMKER